MVRKKDGRSVSHQPYLFWPPNTSPFSVIQTHASQSGPGEESMPGIVTMPILWETKTVYIKLPCQGLICALVRKCQASAPIRGPKLGWCLSSFPSCPHQLLSTFTLVMANQHPTYFQLLLWLQHPVMSYISLEGVVSQAIS